MKFNVIYIEEKIKDYPNTKEILARINYKKIIYCENYNQVFNPKNQNFRIQKAEPSIILAKKEQNFLLNAPEKFTIGYTKNFYFSHMLNCVYDCKYCFLQGMFNSAHYVIFVNYLDFFNAIKSQVSRSKKTIIKSAIQPTHGAKTYSYSYTELLRKRNQTITRKLPTKKPSGTDNWTNGHGGECGDSKQCNYNDTIKELSGVSGLTKYILIVGKPGSTDLDIGKSSSTPVKINTSLSINLITPVTL